MKVNFSSRMPFLFALSLVTPMLFGATDTSLKASISKKLTKALQVEVTLGDCDFDSSTVVVSDIVIGKPQAQAGNKPFAEIDSLNVDYAPISLLTGNLLLKNLRFKGVRLYIGVDQDGRSSLRAFLARIAGKTGKGIPDLGTISLEDVTLIMHAPKKYVAPGSAYQVGPVSAHFDALTIRPLPIIKKKNPKAEMVVLKDKAETHARIRDAWVEIDFKNLEVRSTLINAPRALPTRVKGKQVEEGLLVIHGNAQLLWNERPNPSLRLRKTLIEGLHGQSYLHAPTETETIVRIARMMAANFAGTKGKAESKSDGAGSIVIEDLLLKDSELEIAGPDAHGKIAYWGLSNLNIEVFQVSFGKRPDLDFLKLKAKKKPNAGHLRLVSDTVSSEGKGRLEITWENIKGSYPTWSSHNKLDVKNLALPALSTRLGNKEEAGFVRGRMGLLLTGVTTAGQLDWKGHLIVSTDTQLSRGWESTKSSQKLNKVATGRPIEPLKVRGTLTALKIKAPSAVMEGLKGIRTGFQDAGRFIKDEMLGRLPLIGQIIRAQ